MLLGSKWCSVWLPHGPVWSSVLSTRPSTSGMDGCTPVWELMDNTLNICSETQTSLFDWFYWFMTLLRLRVWHAVRFLLALQGTSATCKARFGGLSDVKVSLQNPFAKIMKFGWHLANLLHTVKGPLFKTCKYRWMDHNFSKVRYQHSKQAWWVNMHTFIANFLGYAASKYYWNWIIFSQVFAKLKRVTFFWNTVYIPFLLQTKNWTV